MKLHLKRSEEKMTTGMLSKKEKSVFNIFARVELSPDERVLFDKAYLGAVIFFSHSRNDIEIQHLMADLIEPKGWTFSDDNLLTVNGVERKLKEKCEIIGTSLKTIRDDIEKEEVIEY